MSVQATKSTVQRLLFYVQIIFRPWRAQGCSEAEPQMQQFKELLLTSKP